MDIPSTPFLHVLNTNYAPNGSELIEIHALCSKPIEEIRRLDIQIEQLTARRQQLQEFVNAHKALASPIRRLYPEILQLIFTLCLPSNRNAAMCSTEAPVLLGRVCSRWRAISLQTAFLWSTIHLVTSTTSSDSDNVRLHNGATEWLNRSGNLPLSLSFVVSREHEIWPAPVNSPSYCRSIRPVFDLILRYIKRCKALALGMPFSVFTILSANAPVKNKDIAPLLVQLCLSMPHPNEPPSNQVDTDSRPAQALLTRLLNSPNLKRLFCSQSTSSSTYMRQTIVNFGQLTVLRLVISDSMSSWPLEVLQSCGQLEYLQFIMECREGEDLSMWPHNPDFMPRPVVMLRLTHLCLACRHYWEPEGTEIVSQMLGYLMLPSLQVLTLQFIQGVDFTFLSTIYNVCVRSSCSLSKLRVNLSRGIMDNFLSNINFAPFPDTIPHLTHLFVEFASTDSDEDLDVVHLLNYLSDASKVSELKSLELIATRSLSTKAQPGLTETHQLIFTAAQNFLRSRWVPSLQSIEMHCPHFKHFHLVLHVVQRNPNIWLNNSNKPVRTSFEPSAVLTPELDAFVTKHRDCVQVGFTEERTFESAVTGTRGVHISDSFDYDSMFYANALTRYNSEMSN